MEEFLNFLAPIVIGIAWWGWLLIGLAILAFSDIFFRREHTILHNYPIIGHLRYLIEKVGPEFRQYIVANNREERPFNRLQRGWVYSSSKLMNNYEGFGTEQDYLEHQYIFIKQDMMSYKVPDNHPNKKDPYFLPSAKVIGAHRRRPYRPKSIVNISAMSFGSLSAKAQESLNKGAKKAGCFHNTGEGGLSPYHSYGADVVFHFGTGYFGVRSKDGGFSMDKMEKLVENNSFIRSIEVKLSQGAKPGKGGVLPGAKITAEIAEIRGVKIVSLNYVCYSSSAISKCQKNEIFLKQKKIEFLM
jgi:glutamate synthase domain-containing protein 2